MSGPREVGLDGISGFGSGLPASDRGDPGGIGHGSVRGRPGATLRSLRVWSRSLGLFVSRPADLQYSVRGPSGLRPCWVTHLVTHGWCRGRSWQRPWSSHILARRGGQMLRQLPRQSVDMVDACGGTSSPGCCRDHQRIIAVWNTTRWSRGSLSLQGASGFTPLTWRSLGAFGSWTTRLGVPATSCTPEHQDLGPGFERVSESMIRLAVVGVGKMGLSHLSILGAHPKVRIEAICDTGGYVLDVLNKYTGVTGVDDYYKMLARLELDAVVIATPTKAHFPMVKAALDHGLHVFCEKPLTLRSEESDELAAIASERGLHCQVGYHNRFVAAFGEAKRLLELGAIGEVKHALAEAYGPVVLRPKGSTWRSRRSEGGGCLYDYAAHPLDLLTWYLGAPTRVGGTALGHVFSAETEDEVYSTLFYPGGETAQLSVNWSDESFRKMTTRITLTGTKGRIAVDRQECQVYLRDTATPPEGYTHGWNVRYTTDLTPPVWFYVRGEEYSAELAYFIESISGDLEVGAVRGQNSFESAAITDRVMELMIEDAATPVGSASVAGTSPSPTIRGLARQRVSAGLKSVQARWRSLRTHRAAKRR